MHKFIETSRVFRVCMSNIMDTKEKSEKVKFRQIKYQYVAVICGEI